MKIMTQILKGVLCLLFIAQAQAGIPVWSFTPLTNTHIAIDNTQRAIVSYRVTNNSQIPHALALRNIPGLRAVNIPRSCSASNPIRFGESCNVTLFINGQNLTTPILGGPVLCDHGNPLMCYQPSAANSLQIRRSNSETLFTIGGNISGLIGTVILQRGTELLTATSDGNFTFTTPQPSGTPYVVTVNTQPAGQLCTVSNGIGIVLNANVTNIIVTCSPIAQTYTVGGTVNGLTGTVVLQNNGELVSVTSPATLFAFSPHANGSPYNVTVQTQPVGQICTVANGTGTISGANVTNVIVTCSATTFSLGGTVTGLAPGNSLVLGNFGANPVPIAANGPFVFLTEFPNGSPYSVTVLVQPATQFCTVTNGTGTIVGADVTNILVNCTASGPASILYRSVPNTIAVGVPTAIPVFNNSPYTATNVHIELPSGWTEVTQDATQCLVMTSGAQCNIILTSPRPYVAQTAPLVGDNVATPYSVSPLAFTINGFYVFSVDSPTTATIVNPIPAGLSATFPWSPPVTLSTGAISTTDGASNTAAIITAFGPTGNLAAQVCYNSTANSAPVGAWYLPAICQLGTSAAGGPTCPAGFANINTLYQFFYFFGIFPGSVSPWSSTEIDGSTAWGFHFDYTQPLPFTEVKTRDLPVMCAESVTF